MVLDKEFSKFCETTDTLLRAVYEVATALNAKAYVKNVRRCSTRPAIAADALSKANFKLYWDVWPEHELEPVKLPMQYIKWLQSPVKDNDLGHRIIEEMKANGEITLF